jgi:hypothetical protein
MGKAGAHALRSEGPGSSSGSRVPGRTWSGFPAVTVHRLLA